MLIPFLDASAHLYSAMSVQDGPFADRLTSQVELSTQLWGQAHGRQLRRCPCCCRAGLTGAQDCCCYCCCCVHAFCEFLDGLDLGMLLGLLLVAWVCAPMCTCCRLLAQ